MTLNLAIRPAFLPILGALDPITDPTTDLNRGIPSGNAWLLTKYMHGIETEYQHRLIVTNGKEEGDRADGPMP